MKKSKNGASILRRCCVLLMAVMLLTGMLGISSVWALDADDVSRLNVMLVIDGSGSLTMSGGTDNQGYRYDAIDLFLALLTNDGNNAGAIVFNHETLLNTPIAPISGKADKLALSQKIRDASAYGDTNIGGALLSAVDACKAATEQNGMKSVILLFSDGRTDVYNHGGQKAQDASLEAKEQAAEMAQDAGIPIHSICLNASSASDPAELQELSTRTSGTFASVEKAEDLTKAFENFYTLIFPNSSNELRQNTFSSDGKLALDITIPAYGAEEVNVILDTTNVDSTAINAPSGALSGSTVEDNTMSGGFYDVVKLVDPENGLWSVNLTGKPGTNVTVNVLYNIDTTVQLKTADSKNDYGVGDTVTFQANLLNDSQVITDPMVTQEYTAQLVLFNPSTGETAETITMTPEASGMFTCTYTGTNYSSYNATATLTYSQLALTSDPWLVNFGNTAPVAIQAMDVVRQTVTPVSGKSKTVDVSAYFTDAQDTTLTYSILSSQLIQGTTDLDPQTGTLNINTGKSRSGDVVIQAADSQGATAQMTVRMKVTNLTGVIFGTGGLLILGLIAALIAWLVIINTQPFHGKVIVRNLATGDVRSRGSFRGRLALTAMGIRGCGFDKGVLIVKGKNRVIFNAKQPIFTQTYAPSANNKKAKTVVTLSTGMPTTVFADENQARGLEIILEPSLRHR